MGLFDFFKKKEPGNVLVLTDYSDQQIQQIYTSEISLKVIYDFYNSFRLNYGVNTLLNGYLSLYKVPDINVFRNKDIKKVRTLLSGQKIEWTHFAGEAYYAFACQDQHLQYTFEDFQQNMIPKIITSVDKWISENTMKDFNNYRRYMSSYKQVKDIPRSQSFLRKVLDKKSTLQCFYKEELSQILCNYAVRYHKNLDFVPKEYLTKKMVLKQGYLSTTVLQRINFFEYTDLEIIQLLRKRLISNNSINSQESLYKQFSYLPKERVNEKLLSILHTIFDKKHSKELSYGLIIYGLEVTSKNAFNAMTYFADHRFLTKWDPCGADNFGQVCGCEYEVNKSIVNPTTYFKANLLTLKQWHSLIAKDTRLLAHIPQEIVNREELWYNYKDFIGKGRYIQHPDNVLKYEYFDQREVFSRMPEKFKKIPQ